MAAYSRLLLSSLCLLGIALLGTLTLNACGEEECGVSGENCSVAYKEANNVDYDCCPGLSCQENHLGDLVCR